MSASAKTKWTIEGDYLQACSCDYGCPCEFSAPPTKGFCEGAGAWRIHRGNFGDINLDGLAMAFVARWPKAIHEGNGTCCLFFDDRATAPQRDALFQICSGQCGGMPFEIIVTTFSKILDPQYVPFTFNLNGRNSSVKIGNAVSIEVEPIKNPVTNEPESVRVEHATGFIFKAADCVSATRMEANTDELKFSWPNKAGFVSQIKYSN
jgi:hypothetical protein